jgi:hypothetical protein
MLVSDWFWTDQKETTGCLKWQLLKTTSLLLLRNKYVDLVELEEMTFCSQLLARYQTLLGGTDTGMSLVEPEVLPEWTWKYASLKRFLARPQWECSQPSSSCIHCHGTIHSGAKCRGGCTMPLFKSVRMSGFYTITTSKWNCGAFYIA